MTDDRPSIAELQRRRCGCTHEAGDSDCERHPTCPDCGFSLETTALFAAHSRLVGAAPMLLEITAAALAWQEARDAWMVAPTGPAKARFTEMATALADALSKVRP